MKHTIFAILLFASSNLFAYSNLDCTSNQNISYSQDNRVGGARPFPGMVIGLEEIMVSGETLFRTVTRAECRDDQNCELQSPELTDIHPEGLTFHFDEGTKKVIATYGEETDPVYKEVYAVMFSLGHRPAVWMICDYYRVLAP